MVLTVSAITKLPQGVICSLGYFIAVCLMISCSSSNYKSFNECSSNDIVFISQVIKNSNFKLVKLAEDEHMSFYKVYVISKLRVITISLKLNPINTTKLTKNKASFKLYFLVSFINTIGDVNKNTINAKNL